MKSFRGNIPGKGIRGEVRSKERGGGRKGT